jgi:dipeptide/tripeptide permease
MNTALAPFYLSSIVGGWISDQFGYHAVFALGALSSIIGVALLIFRVEDPDPRYMAPSRSADRVGSTYED